MQFKYNIMRRIKTTSRLFEVILGCFGSFIAIISSSFLLFLQSGGKEGNSFLAILAIIGSILGFISSIYVSKNSENAGVGFIIASLFVTVGSPHLGVIGSIFMVAAGISSLFRK